MPDKLLQVLDMTEEEQHTEIVRLAWHLRKTSPALANYHREAMGGYMEISLADLAFRLRDEAKDDFVFGLIEVFQYITERSKFEIPSPAEMIKESQPIHWIIAALKGTDDD